MLRLSASTVAGGLALQRLDNVAGNVSYKKLSH